MIDFLLLGKIEKTDWNVKEIEKKIAESKTANRSPRQRAEKVPKWSRQQFDDKVSHCIFFLICFTYRNSSL